MKAVIALLFVALAATLASCEAGKAQAACAGDACLPDVKFIDTSGHAHTPEALRGKVVVVNLRGTGCVRLKRQVPDLPKHYLKYKDGGVVRLGVLSNHTPSEAD